jgi:hypothetical protein
MKQTAVEWLVEQMINQMELRIENTQIGIQLFEQAKEMEKEQMLEFGSKITDRWGLTRVEPQYIEDEYNKYYKSK